MQDDQGWLVSPEEQLNPKYVERAAVLDAIKRSTERAILIHDETVEECSSAGGSHAFFTLVQHRSTGRKAPPLKEGLVHYGGHGAMLQVAFKKGEVWVASFEPLGVPESVKNSAWCVPDRTIHGRAIALLRVESREAAIQLLDALK